jgi:hypothetical protein
LATIISADLPALGRVRIGTKISFEQSTLEEARNLRRRLIDEMNGMNNRIVSLSMTSADLTGRLLNSNLISGAHNAGDWN